MIENPEIIDDQNHPYPDYHNETIVIDDNANQFLFYLLAISLLSISIISACCKGVPTAITRMYRTRQLSHLTDYILQRETEEEVNITIETCSICIESYLPRQKTLTLPCTHKFHSHCIKDWLEKELTCPNCRQPLLLN